MNWTQEGFDISTKPGRALKFFKEATTWDDAKKKCGNLIRPGFLITVDDEDVNAWVMDKKVVTWIGLNDKVLDYDCLSCSIQILLTMFFMNSSFNYKVLLVAVW